METLKTPQLLEIIEAANIHPKKVKGCYIFGSRCYQTASEFSDWDIILIANSTSYETEIVVGNYNIHIITPDLALKYAKDNHIKAIELICAPEWAKLLEFDFKFVYKEDSFRHNISHTVSNSWVKAKKKIQQGDYYIGIKSLFHSLRIADFGTQFASRGRIDFTSSNWIWKEINSEAEFEWEDLFKRYKPLLNERLTEFRKLASKKNPEDLS